MNPWTEAETSLVRAAILHHKCRRLPNGVTRELARQLGRTQGAVETKIRWLRGQMGLPKLHRYDHTKAANNRPPWVPTPEEIAESVRLIRMEKGEWTDESESYCVNESSLVTCGNAR